MNGVLCGIQCSFLGANEGLPKGRNCVPGQTGSKSVSLNSVLTPEHLKTIPRG